MNRLKSGGLDGKPYRGDSICEKRARASLGLLEPRRVLHLGQDHPRELPALQELPALAASAGDLVFGRADRLFGSAAGLDPHQVAVTYAKASNDKVLGTNTGANQIGVGYMYSMSKRTNAFATYQRVTNQSAAAYYAAGMPTPAYTGSAGMAALAGEDYRIIQVGMNHSF